MVRHDNEEELFRKRWRNYGRQADNFVRYLRHERLKQKKMCVYKSIRITLFSLGFIILTIGVLFSLCICCQINISINY